LNLTEKYRPRDWSEVAGQEDIVRSIRANIANRDKLGMPHYLFVGPTPGVGKTTIATLIAKELGVSFHEFNASDKRGIDFIRDEIKKLSQFKGERVIFLDEADNLTGGSGSAGAAQQALRRIMEQTENAIFILTGNYEDQIIDAIKSRCVIHTFPPLKSQDVQKKIVEIIKGEQIKLDISTPEKQAQVRAGIRRLVEQANGDLRSAINNLEKIIDEDLEITPESVAVLRDATSLHTLALKYALEGDFDSAKDAIEKAHIEGRYDSRRTFRELYKALETVKPKEVRIRLYSKLGEVEANSKRGGDAIIQLIYFVAYAWLVPHLSRCPVLSGDNKV